MGNRGAKLVECQLYGSLLHSAMMFLGDIKLLFNFCLFSSELPGFQFNGNQSKSFSCVML